MSIRGYKQMQASTPVGVSGFLSAAEIEARLRARYQASGYSNRTWENDRALYRRLCRTVAHPALATVTEMETIVLSASRTNSRAMYVERLKSLFQTMRELQLIPNDCRPDEQLPTIRRTRGLPRPLAPDEADVLLSQAANPMRDWFVLGCFAGLRAMEVAGLRGTDLEQVADGYVLRIRGKGKTELTLPAHPLVVELFQQQGRLGRLWQESAHTVSRKACAEMRRLGVNMQFHSCRHYFATTVLAASGGDIVTTSNLMRHSSIQTTMGYAKLADDRPRNVMYALAVPHHFSGGGQLHVSLLPHEVAS